MTEKRLKELEKDVQELKDKYVELLALCGRLLGAQEHLMEEQHRHFAERVRKK